MKTNIDVLWRLALSENGELCDHAIRACNELYALRTAIYEIAYKSTEGDAVRMRRVALDALEKFGGESKEASAK